MADDGRFFGETDPEWAISQLAAQVAASSTAAERVSPWRVIVGVLFTTALVAGAFLMGLTHDTTVPDSGVEVPMAAGPTVTLQPVVERPVAPQATLEPAPIPAPVEEPAPVVPAYVAPTAPVQAEPDHKPSRPANQVGPNRPIKTPIDPDGR